MKFSVYFFSIFLASVAALSGLQKVDSEAVPTRIPSLKDLAIRTIIKQGISVQDDRVPVELAQLIKKEMLGEDKIDCIEILKKVPVPREKVAALPRIEFIASLSPNGKKLLAHHSENHTFSVWDADSGKMVYEIPKHCNCKAVPFYSFSYDGNDLAFYTPCVEHNQEKLEIFRTGRGRIQTILFSDFCAQAVKLSRDGSMCVCAGGCGAQLRVFKRNSTASCFEAVGSFGDGYIIAISHDNKKIAALTHGDLTLYASDTGQVLYRITAWDSPNLQFSRNDDLLIAAHRELGTLRKTAIDETSAFLRLRVDEKTDLSSVAFSSKGQKITSLVDGGVRFTYLMPDEAEKFLELERPRDERDESLHEKFNLVRLHDDDTVVTACTNHAVYRYDVEELCKAESRFAKSIDAMAIDDVPVACSIMKMTDYEYKKRVLQPLQNGKEATRSFMQRMKFPLLGAAVGLFFVWCARGE